MKKILIIVLITVVLGFSAFYAFVYFVSFSEGDRAGKLVKISRKGVLFKTYEGILSQGVSDEQIFYFSILDNQDEAIEKLKSLQGQNVKLTYQERFRTFAWWGDSRYFVTNVEKIKEHGAANDTGSNLYEEILKLKQRVKNLEEIIFGQNKDSL